MWAGPCICGLAKIVAKVASALSSTSEPYPFLTLSSPSDPDEVFQQV